MFGMLRHHNGDVTQMSGNCLGPGEAGLNRRFRVSSIWRGSELGARKMPEREPGESARGAAGLSTGGGPRPW